MDSSSNTVLLAALLSMAPISELRGGLPYALANGIPIYLAYPLCVLSNALVSPLLYMFMGTLHRLLYRWSFYRKLFDRIIQSTRRRIERSVKRYGLLGIALFVAIPLPMTGAYSGSLGAWLLGVSPLKCFFASLLGLLLAGCIVAVVTQLGIQVLG